MTKPTGGPAYPIPIISQNNSTGETTIWQTEGGMTLRDYFAAMALQGFFSSGNLRQHDGTLHTYESLTAECYYAADAMLAEREK